VQALENKGGDGGEILASARREGSVAVIEVADTGPGVPEKARAHLFQAFQGAARKGGSGLGLAIAHELVQAHGGQIALVKNQGGATFRVTIPDAVVELEHARRRRA
jgi:signal transduction histidine kinase